MKKHFLQLTAIAGIFFFTACSDSDSKNTKQDDNSETKTTGVQTGDSVKKTTISVGADGAAVTTKNTDVEVNRTGVKVGTKDVKVDIKAGK